MYFYSEMRSVGIWGAQGDNNKHAHIKKKSTDERDRKKIQ
jgi:hypothetical protein